MLTAQVDLIHALWPRYQQPDTKLLPSNTYIRGHLATCVDERLVVRLCDKYIHVLIDECVITFKVHLLNWFFTAFLFTLVVGDGRILKCKPVLFISFQCQPLWSERR